MDNKLNEIRRKIRFLRAEMLSAEDNIRKRVNRDEDCSEASVHLMSMRVVMLGSRTFFGESPARTCPGARAGSRQGGASNQESRAPFRFNRNAEGSRPP
jgi:hypothetical protein